MVLYSSNSSNLEQLALKGLHARVAHWMQIRSVEIAGLDNEGLDTDGLDIVRRTGYCNCDSQKNDFAAVNYLQQNYSQPKAVHQSTLQQVLKGVTQDITTFVIK